MSRMSRRARKRRIQAIRSAIVEIAGEDALSEEPDLVYALDEILSSEDDNAIRHLAESAASAGDAEDIVTDLRRADGRTRSESTDPEQDVRSVARSAKRALDAYVTQRARDRIEDATEWLGGDVSLDDLDLEQDQEESR